MKKVIPLSKAHRIINHGPVVLVTSQAEGKNANIIAVAWITPVSQFPPLVAISIADEHYSHELISLSGEFVVNVPSSGMAQKVMDCGKVSGRDVNKFKEFALTPVPAKKVFPPLINECIGHLECRVKQQVKVGDHTLFIGNIVMAWAEENLFGELWNVDVKGGEALHHLGGNNFAISREKVIVRE